MAKLNEVVTGEINPGHPFSGLFPPKQAKAAKSKVKPRKRAKVKAKRAKAAKTTPKQTKSTVNCFVYPNKGKGEVDEVKISLNGKKQSFQALTEVKLDIMALDIGGLVKQFFIALNSPKLSGVRFGYKNAYSIAFGLTEVRPTSYKSVITHHLSDGLACLVFNQAKHANIDRIKSALEKAGLSFVPKPTYAYVNLSKDNLPKVVKVAKAILGLSKG